MDQVINIAIEWDAEAKTYLAYSEDLHGLTVEADTIPEILREMAAVIDELLKLNHGIDLLKHGLVESN